MVKDYRMPIDTNERFEVWEGTDEGGISWGFAKTKSQAAKIVVGLEPGSYYYLVDRLARIGSRFMHIFEEGVWKITGRLMSNFNDLSLVTLNPEYGCHIWGGR